MEPPLNTQYIEKFNEKWSTECLNTRFPSPTLLNAGYIGKLFFYILYELKMANKNARCVDVEYFLFELKFL